MNITNKQKSYLTYLLEKNGYNLKIGINNLNTKEASRLIASLKKGERPEDICDQMLKSNIKRLFLNKLLPTTTLKDSEISNVCRNINHIVTKVIDCIELEMTEIESEVLKTEEDYEYGVDRLKRLKARQIFLKGLKKGTLMQRDIQGINKKLKAYTHELLGNEVNLAKPNWEEVDQFLVKALYI